MTSPPVLITQTEQLGAMLRRLMNAPAVGVDTESDSLYVYREKVCLVQLSIPDVDYLVDPLAPGLSLEPLGKLFAAPGVVKVFHAAEYDVMCLKRDAGFQFRNLFDTMWAARILGWPQFGLLLQHDPPTDFRLAADGNGDIPPLRLQYNFSPSSNISQLSIRSFQLLAKQQSAFSEHEQERSPFEIRLPV